MPISEAQKKASNKYNLEHMTVLGCKVKKAEAAAFKEYAAQCGKTSNAMLKDYVIDCITDKRPERPDSLATPGVQVTGAKAAPYQGTPAEPLTQNLRSVPEEREITPTPERANPEPDIRLDTISKPLAGVTSAVAPAEPQLSIFPADPDAKPKRVNPPPIPAEVREACRQDYIAGMAVADIAAKHKLARTTVASWVTRGNWEKGANTGI